MFHYCSISSTVQKRHLALFMQNLYEKYTQKSKKCNFLKKMRMNILVTYHFGKLITCPIHWYIQNPAYLKFRFGFNSRVAWQQKCNVGTITNLFLFDLISVVSHLKFTLIIMIYSKHSNAFWGVASQIQEFLMKQKHEIFLWRESTSKLSTLKYYFAPSNVKFKH